MCIYIYIYIMLMMIVTPIRMLPLLIIITTHVLGSHLVDGASQADPRRLSHRLSGPASAMIYYIIS